MISNFLCSSISEISWTTLCPDWIKKSLNSDSKIIVKSSNDLRSYRQNSQRIIKEGFKPEKKIEDAIIEIRKKYNEKKITKKNSYYRVNTLKMIKAK